MKRTWQAYIFVLIIMAILLAGCGGNDAPPAADTPEPAALNGVYESELGSFEFNGDRKTVIVHASEEMSKRTEMPQGDTAAQYVFIFHNGTYRYDKAEYFRIIVEDKTYQFDNDFTQTNESRIVIRLGSDSEPTVFERGEN